MSKDANLSDKANRFEFFKLKTMKTSQVNNKNTNTNTKTLARALVAGKITIKVAMVLITMK